MSDVVTLPESHSFCESVHAGSRAPWHIRIVKTARHFGGGIDSDPLCGRRIMPFGWDIETKSAIRAGICKACLYKLEAER